MAAGERALGKQVFEEYAGHFWGMLETRPYMRARQGLAQCLWEAGRREEAAEHYQALLRLNPDDNQGVRYSLATLLLDMDRDQDLRRLLAEYEDDASAVWAYTKTLLAFREGGELPAGQQVAGQGNEGQQARSSLFVGAQATAPTCRRTSAWAEKTRPSATRSAIAAAGSNTPGAISWLRKTLDLPLPEPAQAPAAFVARTRLALRRLPQSRTKSGRSMHFRARRLKRPRPGKRRTGRS